MLVDATPLNSQKTIEDQKLDCSFHFPSRKTLHSEWSDEIRSAASELTDRLLAHPFLVRCDQGAVTMGELRNFLIQHGKYSRYFTRYLCALISNLSDGEDVLRLAENLSEELGYGDEKCIPHSHIYANMLRGFQITSMRKQLTQKHFI